MPRKLEYYVGTKCDATFKSEGEALEHEKNCSFRATKKLVEYQLYADVELEQSGEAVQDVYIEYATRELDATCGRGCGYSIESYDEYGAPFDKEVYVGVLNIDIDTAEPTIITVTSYQLREDPEPWTEMKKEALAEVERVISELNAVKNKLKEEEE